VRTARARWLNASTAARAGRGLGRAAHGGCGGPPRRRWTCLFSVDELQAVPPSRAAARELGALFDADRPRRRLSSATSCCGCARRGAWGRCAPLSMTLSRSAAARVTGISPAMKAGRMSHPAAATAVAQPQVVLCRPKTIWVISNSSRAHLATDWRISPPVGRARVSSPELATRRRSRPPSYDQPHPDRSRTRSLRVLDPPSPRGSGRIAAHRGMFCGPRPRRRADESGAALPPRSTQPSGEPTRCGAWLLKGGRPASASGRCFSRASRPRRR